MDHISPNSIIIVSGGFEILHRGSINLFKACKEHNATVIAGLNSDAWLRRKHNREPFKDFDERRYVLESVKYIDAVYSFDDSDDTACDLIRRIVERFQQTKIYFANGGDRTPDNVPEQKVCDALGVEMIQVSIIQISIVIDFRHLIALSHNLIRIACAARTAARMK